MDMQPGSDWGAAHYVGAGGVLAGLIAAFGKGLAWLVGWRDARGEGRQARLDAWEKSLADREQAYREEIEARLEAVQKEQAVLRAVLFDVTMALQRHDPANPEIGRAMVALGQMA